MMEADFEERAARRRDALKAAEEEKQLGNDAFKAKKYPEAVSHYSKAGDSVNLFLLSF